MLGLLSMFCCIVLANKPAIVSVWFDDNNSLEIMSLLFKHMAYIVDIG